MTLQRAASAVLAVLLLSVSAPGCLDAPEYFYGYDLTDTQVVIYDVDMGVHPNTSVMSDPNNPFRLNPTSFVGKFDVGQVANNSAVFYAFATQLAIIPVGENQYYTALAAENIWRSGELSPAELPYIRDIALKGYRSLLDNFPESISFDPTGQFPFRLAPLAYERIIAMGATPPPGWEVVDGVVIHVPSDAETIEEVITETENPEEVF